MNVFGVSHSALTAQSGRLNLIAENLANAAKAWILVKASNGNKTWTELGGLALLDLGTELGILNLKYMRDAIYSQTEAGKLMLLNVKYSQIESGIKEPLLEHPGILPISFSATVHTGSRFISLVKTSKE